MSANAAHLLKNIKVAKTPIEVSLPDGTKIKSTHTAELNIPQIPPEASACHIFPDLKHGSLISIGSLCSAGFNALFTDDTVEIRKHGEVVLRGFRSEETAKMWLINIKNPTVEQGHANAIFPAKSKKEIVDFYHACFGSPPLSTFTSMIEAGLALPGLTVEGKVSSLGQLAIQTILS